MTSDLKTALLSLALLALTTLSSPPGDVRDAPLPAPGGAYSSSSGWNGNYHVKDVSGNTWNLEITVDDNGDGTYKKTDGDGNTTDCGTINTASGGAAFSSEWSDCEGGILEDEDDPGHYTWFVYCPSANPAVNAGLMLKK